MIHYLTPTGRLFARSVCKFSIRASTNMAVEGAFFLHNWNPEKQKRVLEICLNNSESEFDEDCRLFWNTFKAKEHIKTTISHKEFVVKTYERFNNCFSRLNMDLMKKHDDSKFSFVEIIGYTDRFVWQQESRCWSLGK
jgi:hypothetical protein